ncbi:MAG: type II toxin-antitoxin system RelE/ParE family toxin [Clostridia bacterium]|nr:type II toxin-antitoxin system RelE/ParE family toxin [Clostridia bacterium]
MEYTVEISNSASHQILEAKEYILNVSNSSNISNNWLDNIESEIESLRVSPFRNRLMNIEPWKSRGMRKMNVKGFIIYYYVDKNTKTVNVVAFIYGKRNQIAQLNKIEKTL